MVNKIIQITYTFHDEAEEYWLELLLMNSFVQGGSINMGIKKLP